MLFVIDIGNSHTVTGIYDGETLIAKWRLKSDRNTTADELAIRYQALFSMANIDTRKVSGVVVASVVPTLETVWVSCCQKYFFTHLEQQPLVVNAELLEGMITIRLPNPDEVGADRLVNGISGYARCQSDLVVVDFGTAITFDCVTADCSYVGGSILPGIAISLEALSAKTAKLPQIDVSVAPKAIIGTSTVEAMKSGILYGYGAMIDGLLKGIRSEISADENNDFHVIATGGMASLIAPYVQVEMEINPLLTLEGLRIIHQRLAS